PFADKLLTGVAIILLAIIVPALMSWWAAALILVREIGITVLRFFMVRRSVMAASKGGKLKTVLQVVFLSLMMLPSVALFGDTAGDVVRLVAYVLMLIATAVTVITGLDYCWRAWRIAHSQQVPPRSPPWLPWASCAGRAGHWPWPNRSPVDCWRRASSPCPGPRPSSAVVPWLTPPIPRPPFWGCRKHGWQH